MVEIDESHLFNTREFYRDQSGKTFVYFGQWQDPASSMVIEVAVKSISTQGMSEPYTYLTECRNQLMIDSDNVCKIYGWSIQPQKVLIVMEKLDGDLTKEIEMRKKQNYSFKQDELKDLMRQVVSVFGEMQRLHISHNDIKAENIFVKKMQGKITYKVGDFGSASVVRCMEHSLTGTPLYLSPILKQEYARFSMYREKREIRHDTFKSDVFSLGVTLLYAAEFIIPNDLLDMANLQMKIDNHIASIYMRYPEIAQYLGMMLKIDESARCDFEQLEEILGISQKSLDIGSSQVLSPVEYVLDIASDIPKHYANGGWKTVKVLLEMERSHIEIGVLPNCIDCQVHQSQCGMCIGQRPMMCCHCFGLVIPVCPHCNHGYVYCLHCFSQLPVDAFPSNLS